MPIFLEEAEGSFAGRTFKELQEEVLSFQFDEGKYLSLVKKWLNDAVRKIVLQSEIRTQEERAQLTTVQGESTLSLPEDFARFIDFYDESTRRAVTPMKEFDSLPESSGRPSGYKVIGNELNLWPTPDQAYGLALRYWKLPTDMVADGDYPSLPKQYHDLPIAYAMQKAYARENDYQASRFWKEEWEAGVLKMRGEVENDVADGPTQLGGTWGNEPIWTGPLVWKP